MLSVIKGRNVFIFRTDFSTPSFNCFMVFQDSHYCTRALVRGPVWLVVIIPITSVALLNDHKRTVNLPTWCDFYWFAYIILFICHCLRKNDAWALSWTKIRCLHCICVTGKHRQVISFRKTLPKETTFVAQCWCSAEQGEWIKYPFDYKFHNGHDINHTGVTTNTFLCPSVYGRILHNDMRKIYEAKRNATYQIILFAIFNA